MNGAIHAQGQIAQVTVSVRAAAGRDQKLEVAALAANALQALSEQRDALADVQTAAPSAFFDEAAPSHAHLLG
jgi:hypothetical protein